MLITIEINERGVTMYLTVKEAADYLSIGETAVEKLIQQKRIRTIFDGEQYLIYKEQFNTHLKQMEKYKLLVEEVLSEPIPEDIDVKDED
jgi:excisionase family DNA binding protein